MLHTTGKRKRARKACEACRKRKRKCDGGHPCTMCHTYEYDCSYSADRVPTPEAVVPDPNSLSPRSGAPVVGECSGVINEHTTRYPRPSAMVAFPQVLSTSLDSDGPSESGPIAFNFGLRPETTQSRYPHLSVFMSEEELRQLSAVYFSTIAIIGDFIERELFSQRCHSYYRQAGTASDNAFGAVIAGVAGLGSFFSAQKHPDEAELIQYAKNIVEDPISMRKLDVDHLTAWGLRMLFLRSAARAENAWIASCTLMHLCEAIGIHDEDIIKRLTDSPTQNLVAKHDANALRRLFWIAWAGHNILAYEYDRTPVCLRSITCEPPISTCASVTEQFVRIAQVIPGSRYPIPRETKSKLDISRDLCDRIRTLSAIEVSHQYLINTKADVAFCFYRRLHTMKTCVPETILQVVIDIGSAAVGSATQMATQGNLLWNVIGSVFHYICVLLAMDISAATAKLADAFRGLETVISVADTRLTREALAMTRHLLALKSARTRKELAQLEAVEQGLQDSAQKTRMPEIEPVGIPRDEVNWDVDWSQFITEPYLWMLNPE